MNTFYLKIKGIDGNITVAGFDKTMELSDFTPSKAENSLTSDNRGQSYVGIPRFSDAVMFIKNIPGSVSSKLEKKHYDTESLEEVTVYEIAKINGEETDIFHVTYTNSHIKTFQRENRDALLVIGAFSSLESRHVDIDEKGKAKPFVVKYDLTTGKSS